MKKHVVIVGAGFAGINVAKQLRSTNYNITIVDKSNHHLFQPLLYQVATAALSPGDIAIPIRALFTKQKNRACGKPVQPYTGLGLTSSYKNSIYMN